MSVNSAFFNQLKSALVPLLKNVIARIPTKVSDLTNDSGYIAASAVSQATKATTTAGTAGTPTILVSEETTGANGTEYTLKRYTGDVLKSKLGISSGGGGGGTDHDFIVTADLDMDTLTLSNISHTLVEIVAASQADKDVRFNAIADFEGAATVIYSLPLINSQSINFSDTTFYKVEFSVLVIDETDTTYVTVTGTNAEGTENFYIKVSEVPNPVSLYLNLNASGDGIANISIPNGSLTDAITIINSGYSERLHAFLGFGANALSMQKTQESQTGELQRFEGTRNGIKYTVGIHIYDDQQDIPQGTYYDSITSEGDLHYVAFTFDRDLDGVSYIRVNATATTQNNATTTTISSVTWPADLESKLSILMAKPQMANVNVLIRETNEFNTFFSLPVQTALPPTLEAAFIGPRGGSLAHMYYAYCKIEIVANEPQSGYYEQLSNGAYITVNCEIMIT